MCDAQECLDILVSLPVFQQASDESLDAIAEGLERYLTIKLHAMYACGNGRPPEQARAHVDARLTTACPRLAAVRLARSLYAPSEDVAADAALDRRLASLQFLTRAQLGVTASDQLSDVSLSIAEKALAQLHTHKTPGDKVHTIVSCCKIVISTVPARARPRAQTCRPGRSCRAPAT